MREQRLYRSVRRLLDEGERIEHVAHMFRRHRWFLPYSMAAFGAFLLLAIVLGFEQWGGRLGLGLAAAAVAATATTEYRVLVATESGLALFRSSRIRQHATELLDWLPDGTVVAPVGTNLVMTDWDVGGRRFTVMRRFQNDMAAMSQR